MQFHLNGFRAGDPSILPAPNGNSPNAPDAVDVLIVGCGPAGLTLAAQLAAFPSIRTLIIEQRPGPLTVGRADGIACRTMEMFEAFGFSGDVLREAYWVNEMCFWTPDLTNPASIVRSGRIQDTEDGLSEFPHVILGQARVHDFLLTAMAKSPARLSPLYSRRLTGLSRNREDSTHPVTALIAVEPDGQEATVECVRARYVVGCDGAHGAVRKAIGGVMLGDSSNRIWGVMDVLAVTNFPDIRLKAAVQSAAGNLLIIPREGGYLVRLYVELDNAVQPKLSASDVMIDSVISAAQRILHPYIFEVKEVAWWSAYEIGQRISDRFDDGSAVQSPRIFIAGDACHTHSPKAGQGMNVSMQDAFNLGWKLSSVLQGRSDAPLLQTYAEERRAVAEELIEFDREFATMFNARAARTTTAGTGANQDRFQRYFVQHGRFTAGTATRYATSIICKRDDNQHLAPGFVVGMRFHSSEVIRLSDAKPVHLGHEVKADGRWRLFAFSDESGLAVGSSLHRLCAFLESDSRSPIRQFSPVDADIDAVIDFRAILQMAHREVDIGQLPAILNPPKGRYGLVDYEKVYCAARHSDIFAQRAVSRELGCVLILRPDQHIAGIVRLDDQTALATFFEGFMVPAA